MAEKKAVTKQMASRYLKGSKRVKGAILDELCALCGWSRRHARRQIRSTLRAPTKPKPRSPRPRVYDGDVIEALRRIWALAGGPCGKRLAPFMTELVQALERHGELALEPEVRTKLLAMSAATIDRVLVTERQRLQVKGRHGTKPGTLLKHQIPIRTFAEWDDARPGFCEVDLVHHDDGAGVGEFFLTLDLTDVSSGWTELKALRNKAQKGVHKAIEEISKSLPFPLAGLDSDNGSEFINHMLFRWCTDNKITFTRARPYRKNDNCFVEQKNWTHVRQMVGYARLDSEAEYKIMVELYEVLRLWLNFFSPQQRLVSKTRHGAKVSRSYDIARTPYQRLLGSEHVSDQDKEKLTATYLEINPAQLSRQIGQLQTKLLAATAAKKRKPSTDKKEVNLSAPDHPWRASNKNQPSLSTRTSEVRQRTAG